MFSHPALSFYLADTLILGVNSVFQTLPNLLFPPPLSPPTNSERSEVLIRFNRDFGGRGGGRGDGGGRGGGPWTLLD